MQQITYTCDVCGKIKGESNHWFLGDSPEGSLIIWTWQSGGIVHLCGEACVLKWVSQNLPRLTQGG